MKYGKHCPNMNHGRKDPPVRFCPSCGVQVGQAPRNKCDSQSHAVRRKARDLFCVDCGLSLTT